MNKYCFDLDGTLCTKVKDYKEAKPIVERINFVNKLYNEGNIILIDTARGSLTQIDWYEITKQQLESWGLKYHQLRVGLKLDADYYIDDKGINDKIFFTNINP